MEAVQLAAVLAAVVVVASMISVELGISVALLELTLAVVAGNIFDLNPNMPWLSFVAGFASIVLTFLAGAEVDPDDFRERFRASPSIGLNAHIINRMQFSLLVTVVVLSAVVPRVIAERWFSPDVEAERAPEATPSRSRPVPRPETVGDQA
jgi:Kef-type K+ transport system membrane component KefB